MTTIGSKQQRNTGFKLLLTAACVFIVIGGLKAASSFLIPIMLGLFLAVISLPITTWLKGHRIPGPLAVIMTVFVDLAVLTGIVLTIVSVMPDFQATAKDLDEEMRNVTIQKVEALETWLESHVAPITAWFSTFGDEETAAEGAEVAATPTFDLRSTVEDMLTVNSLVSFAKWVNDMAVLERITSLITKTFFALILMIFILLEAGKFTEKVSHMIEAKGPNFQAFRDSGRDVQRYLGIKTLASFATGLLAWMVCALFGVEFAILWGLIAFFFNYVPTIGSLVAAVPPVLVAMLQLGFWHSMGITACYLVINIAIGNFIEPMLLGKRFGISTVVVILSVLFWGWLWGPVGMFLAVPLTMMIKMMLDNSDDFRWISVAMGKVDDDEAYIEALIEERSRKEDDSSQELQSGAEA